MKLASTALAVALAAGVVATAVAQTPPAGNQAAAPSSGTTSSGMMGGRGMMSGQGMGGGMMGGGEGMGQGMMGGGQGMMDPGPSGMMPDMDMVDRIAARLAFLRTELKITDAQSKAWDDFAEAIRGNAKALGDLWGHAAARTVTPTVTQRLDDQEQWYTARLDGIKSIKARLAPLYAALSDDQKKTADELLPANIGLGRMRGMGMMSQTGQSGGSPAGMMGGRGR